MTRHNGARYLHREGERAGEKREGKRMFFQGWRGKKKGWDGWLSVSLQRCLFLCAVFAFCMTTCLFSKRSIIGLLVVDKSVYLLLVLQKINK